MKAHEINRDDCCGLVPGDPAAAGRKNPAER